ncbi:MAG: class II aldolase/adducin family protein [Proteobacteria bacterium]|nr:class II aldolase/adducin family protein [Pseudomonadota bacterium]
MSVVNLPGMREDLRGRISSEEWETRLELARCYRLMAKYRMTDLTNTHVSMRVPGTEEHYLINDARLLFHETTASSLIKFNLDGSVLDGSDGRMNKAGFAIHSLVHKARPDALCVMHTHTRAGCALGAVDADLKMINQISFIFHGRIAYNDYGYVEEVADCEGFTEDLGNKPAMMMRNHGLLTCGRTIGEAFILMFYLDKACEIQVDAMGTGAPLLEPPLAVIEKAAEGWWNWYDDAPFGGHDWEALVRDLDRDGRDYAH